MFDFAIGFRKKMGKHACGTGNTHAKSAIECLLPKKFSSLIKILLEIRKGCEAERPFFGDILELKICNIHNCLSGSENVIVVGC